MVVVGELQIGTSIDTSNVDSGLSRVGQGLDNVQSKSGGLTSSFKRMEQSSRELANNFIVLGGVSTGSILALTKDAPALAGAMAKIKVETNELARNLGKALQPAFESFAGILGNVSDFVGEHPDLVGNITTSIVGLTAAFAAFKVGTAFASFAKLIMSPGFLAGVGVVTALGATLLIIKDIFDSNEEVKKFVEEQQALGKSDKEITSSPGYVGRLPAVATGSQSGAASQGGALGSLADWLSDIFKNGVRKSNGQVLKDGV